MAPQIDTDEGRFLKFNLLQEASVTPLEKLIQELPPELQKEVEDFARFLLATKAPVQQSQGKTSRLRLTWAGGLAEFRDQFTSVKLQKQSLDWWVQ